MSKNWDYSRMSEEAAKAGGPEKWIESIKRAAYSRGSSDMKNKLIVPLLAAGVGLGTVGVLAYQKIKEWIAEKKKEKLLTEKESEEAEKFLKQELDDAISKIKQENEEIENE